MSVVYIVQRLKIKDMPLRKNVTPQVVRKVYLPEYYRDVKRDEKYDAIMSRMKQRLEKKKKEKVD